MSLPESLEQAATELPDLADQIRPANGDPHQLLAQLSSDHAGEVLAWVLKNAEDCASELVDAWGEYEEGAKVLLGASEDGLSKVARKVIRKARHRIRSRGIEVEEEPAAVPVVAASRRVSQVDDAFEAASLSAPDFRGARMGYLAERHPGGGARLFEIRFDEARGILDFKVYTAGRSKVRGFLRSLQSAQSQRLFDVPRTALCALVRRASGAQPVDRPLPSGYVEWRGRLFPESLEKEHTPGGLAREKFAAEAARADAAESLAAVAGLVAAAEIGPWPPATSWVGEQMENGREAVDGLGGTERGAAIDAWQESVSKELAAASDSALLARHLEELAWTRSQQDESGQGASALLAVADGLTAADVAQAETTSLGLARARVAAIFAPFVEEIRVVVEDALAENG